MIFTKIRIISADSKHVTDKLSNNALRWLGNVGTEDEEDVYVVDVYCLYFIYLFLQVGCL